MKGNIGAGRTVVQGLSHTELSHKNPEIFDKLLVDNNRHLLGKPQKKLFF